MLAVLVYPRATQPSSRVALLYTVAMMVLPYRLRITARAVRVPVPAPDPVPEDIQTIRLYAAFNAADDRRGSVVRSVSHTMLVEGLRAGHDVIRAEQQRIEALIAQATGQTATCMGMILPQGWSTPRGSDTLVERLWPTRAGAYESIQRP